MKNVKGQLKRALIVFSVVASHCALADSSANSPVPAAPIAPGYQALPFKAPEPGSYQLPLLGTAANGEVLNSHGKATQLHNLMGDKVVVLSFIYATCSDVNGCPLATAVLQKINQRLKQEPGAAAQLRLLTLSFNPEHDKPEVMRQYGQAFANAAVDWHFLTTVSAQALQPILNSYKQSVEKLYDAKGHFTGAFAHNLRVYLIDKNKNLRNIYSVAFLHPDTLLSDIKTLLEEQNAVHLSSAQVQKITRYNAGDNKKFYSQTDYQTDSAALTHRQGRDSDLLKTIQQAPLGLPAVPLPVSNPITKDKVALGRKLFYDRRLSLNNTFSCAMCHIPEQGFTSNEMATAVGVEGRSVRRNSPTLYNVAYSQSLFHDGRESTLEQQIWGPLLSSNEMANPSVGFIIDKINQDTDYRQLFQSVFAKPASMETLGMAIASYQRTLNSADSAFDRWYYGHQKKALSPQARRGFAVFIGKARCASCHTVDAKYALFTDHGFHNTGIGYAQAMHKTSDRQRVQVAPGQFVEVEARVIESVAEPEPNDLGRYEITQKPEDRWRYKTPSLRNISLTAPYMHDGSLGSLQAVVAFYVKGGLANENLDPLIKPSHLSAAEQEDLVAFLQSLTGSNVEELVSDAFAAPVSDAN
jgi:cytochrome c peroxidase